jgi:hypothetical protein
VRGSFCRHSPTNARTIPQRWPGRFFAIGRGEVVLVRAMRIQKALVAEKGSASAVLTGKG